MLQKVSLIPIGNIRFKRNSVVPRFNYNQGVDSVSFSGNYLSRAEVIGVIENSKPISNSGFKGVVYRYDKAQKSYAIKIARSSEHEFNDEAQVLKEVPADINCQRYVDYFKHPKTGLDILVSTFVEGKKGILKNSDDFREFFNILLRLDKANVLHGDLNMANCLFNKDGISLIDFGEGEIFKTGDSYDDFIYPEFVLKSNVVNLEHNGIPDCIKFWAKNGINTYECFRNYLISKGDYYKKHCEFLKSQDIDLSDAVDYEENYSKVLKNPSDRVIENEIRRIDSLYSFENVDTSVNFTRNPDEVIESWKLTIQKVKNQLDYIDTTLKDDSLSLDERKYFKYQKEIMTLFYNQFSSWSSSTFEWLNGLPFRDDLSESEKMFIENKGKKITLPPDIAGLVLK